jgi:FG-GAP-like repeat
MFRPTTARRAARSAIGFPLRVLAAAALAALALPAGAVDPVPTPEPNDCLEEVTASLSAAPPEVQLGNASTVSWQVSYPSYCPVTVRFGTSIIDENIVPRTGSRVVTPTHIPGKSWYLRASYHGDSKTLGWITVRATGLPLPEGPTVRIEGSSVLWRDLLKRALEAGGKTVILAPDVDMDMTGVTVRIAANTTLTSNPTPGLPNPVRNAGSLGPRLWTSDRPEPLLLVRCYDAAQADANVRLEGFRLQGPHWDSASGDDNLERGIVVESCRNVEISNMEISGWSGQGVYVANALGTITSVDQVRVHDNFFHHNQHVGGNGYGVESTGGAHVLIERNLFDYNRHAIAAGGGYSPGSWYTARHNLVLKGGGYHDSYPVYGTWWTHQFDVHGTTDCGPLFFNAPASCGEAGIYYEYSDNAFQYTRGNAIKIRGNPLVSPRAQRNVFAHGDEDDAITQNGWNYQSAITTPLIRQGNRFGVDSFGDYGVCDFDGDGTDDLFQATGANWWWSSGGKMQWTFLKATTERLSQVGLGDFDGDGRCDVVAGNPLQIARGGSGEWEVVPEAAGIDFASLAFADFNGDGRTDFFRRDAAGSWFIMSPGVYAWTEINNSGVPLRSLRFGHFNGDRIADVVAVSGGKWSVSYGGRTGWQVLNRIRGESLDGLLIGDINGNGRDDMLRYRWLRNQSPIPGGVPGGDMGIWEVTYDGNGTNWIRLNTYTAPVNAFAPSSVPGFVGRFGGTQSAARLLTIPAADRFGRMLDPLSGQFQTHSLYAY